MNMVENLSSEIVTEKLEEYFSFREALLIAPLPYWY